MTKEMRRAEGLDGEKKIKKMSAPQPATFEEKNFLTSSNAKTSKSAIPKKLTNLRRKSMGAAASISNPKKNSLKNTYTTLEQEIKQLQIRNQLDLPIKYQPKERVSSGSDFLGSKSKILISSSNTKNNLDEASIKNIDPILYKQRSNIFESKLAQIGKLDNKKIEQLTPNRSSTPDENQNSDQPVQLKQFQFKLNK